MGDNIKVSLKEATLAERSDIGRYCLKPLQIRKLGSMGVMSSFGGQDCLSDLVISVIVTMIDTIPLVVIK